MSPAALAFLVALQAPLPNADEVRAAVEDQLNAACSGLGEQDACASNRATAEIRALACRPAGEDAAACRFERRTRSAARGASAWQAAETRLRFDVETQLWFVDAPAEGRGD